MRRYAVEHEATCSKNPNIAELTCLYCKEKFKVRKRLNKHMKDKHGWGK